MNRTFYTSARGFCRHVMRRCISATVLDRERGELASIQASNQRPLDPPRGGLLAVTHVSHLEPFAVGSVLNSPIHWMSRIEFYRPWWARQILKLGGAFAVDRFGFSLPAVRQAIRHINAGRLVGIFPEGGVAQGPKSVLRGAPVKGGAATIAFTCQVPVVPVVVLGCEKLNAVKPWLPPGPNGKVWIAFGEPVHPPRPEAFASRKAARLEMSRRLGEAFRVEYQRLREHAKLGEDALP